MIRTLLLITLLSCKPSASDRCLSSGGLPKLINCRTEVIRDHHIADLGGEYDREVQHCDFVCAVPESRFGHQATEPK